MRGAIKTAVFEYNEIEAVGGAFLFRPSTTIKGARIRNNDIVLTLEKPNLFQVDEWVKLSNINTASSDIGTILNDGGLTHVYKVISASGKEVTLEGAAADFIAGDELDVTFDSWGEVKHGYRPFTPGEDGNPEGPIAFNPEAWGLYELANDEYVLTEDTEAVDGKIYYEQFYPDYTTVHFSEQYSQEDAAEYENLQNYVDLDITLGAPKYEVYFNDRGYIKNMNLEIRNIDVETTDIIYDEIKTSFEDTSTGEVWYYTIEKYIGNLALFSLELKNTGENFLVAQISEIYKATPESAGVSDSYTRIYSDLNGEIPFVLKPLQAQDTVESLEGGSLISFGYHSSSSRYEDGVHNYGIGINSSDNYVNLPQRAISLFESEIHPNDSVKVTYNYRGILGTLPPLGNNIANSSIYPYMAGTQGIFTNNMYIGDANQYIAFYTDGQNRKQLRIKANQIIYEVTDPETGDPDWNDLSNINEQIDELAPIRVEIESSAGNMFIREDIRTTLTCTVFKGNNDITNQVSSFTWIKYDKDGIEDETWVAPIPSGRTIIIGPADVASKAIFKCEVEF